MQRPHSYLGALHDGGKTRAVCGELARPNHIARRQI